MSSSFLTKIDDFVSEKFVLEDGTGVLLLTDSLFTDVLACGSLSSSLRVIFSSRHSDFTGLSVIVMVVAVVDNFKDIGGLSKALA